MTENEELHAAIESLEQLKNSLGLVYLTTDGVLLARADDDTDDEGNRYMYGLDITGVDTDAEIGEALVALHRGIPAEIALLEAAMDIAKAFAPYRPITHELTLARAINGVTS